MAGMFTFRGPLGDIPDAPLPTRQTGADTSDVQQLLADVERLYFITEALWRILREKHQLQDEEIIRQIAMIDMEDGKLDGRKAPQPPQPCPKCGRNLVKQRMKCMYCGELIVVQPFER
jgi:hypothetical protein